MKNFVNLGLGIFVAYLVVMVPVWIVSAGFGFVAGLVAQELDPDIATFMSIGIQIFTSLIGLVAGAFLAGGITDVALRTARGEKTTIGQFFGGGRYFGSFLLGNILLTLAVAIGYVLCIVPGVIVALGLSQFGFCIVDRGMGAVDALKESWRLTTGQKGRIFVYGLLGALVFIAGAIACLLPAYLVSMPVVLIGAGYAYLNMKGETPRQLA